jgi:hypothetical protein
MERSASEPNHDMILISETLKNTLINALDTYREIFEFMISKTTTENDLLIVKALWNKLTIDYRSIITNMAIITHHSSETPEVTMIKINKIFDNIHNILTNS